MQSSCFPHLIFMRRGIQNLSKWEKLTYSFVKEPPKREDAGNLEEWMNEEEIVRLREETRELVGHRMPKEMFLDFGHPNNRLLVGVTCLRVGYADMAYDLFRTIAKEGPKSSPDRFHRIPGRGNMNKREMIQTRCRQTSRLH
jgi:hypothetical protein